MSRVTLRATRAFHLNGIGTIAVGEEFTATRAQAQFLLQRGRATQVRATQTVQPRETQALEGPSETTGVVELGGGWYELNGEKYHGRAALDKALAGK